MTPIRSRRISTRRRGLSGLIAVAAALAGCSASATPVPSRSAALPTASPVVTLAPSAMASPSRSPSPTAVVVKITPIPGAPDSGTIVELGAAHVRWSPTTLSARAGKVWHVRIKNADGPPEHHNFAVGSGPTFAEQIYQGPNFVMGTFTFDIPALPAGRYLFICTVHPDVMTGTLTLG
jgi:plastocyanin